MEQRLAAVTRRRRIGRLAQEWILDGRVRALPVRRLAASVRCVFSKDDARSEALP